MISETSFISTVNETLNRGDFYNLDLIFSEYTSYNNCNLNTVVRYLSKSNLFLENYIVNTTHFPRLWHVMNERLIDLDEPLKKVIYEKIKCIKVWNYGVQVDIISIVSQMTTDMSDCDRIQQYRKYLSPFFSTQHFNSRITDKLFRCAFLIETISSERMPFIDERESLVFDFSDESFEILVKEIEKQSDHWMIHDFSYLLDHTPVKILSKIIHEKLLTIDGITVYPDSFLKLKIIQRIFINIDLHEEDLPVNFITRLNEFIDLNDKFYGNEMNQYVKKHQININGDFTFIDGIGPIQGGWVQSRPFVPVSSLTNYSQVDILLRLLKDISDWDVCKSENNFLVEQSKEGQNDEIIRVLNSKENWKYNTKYNEVFLEKIINDSELCGVLTPSIVAMIDGAIENGFYNSKIAEAFAKKINFKNTSKISYDEQQVLKALVKNSDSKDDLVFQILFEDIKPSLLSSESIFLDKKETIFVELNDFINTDLGRYYSIIEEISMETLKIYGTVILAEINLLEPPYREYLMGRNIFLYTEENVPSATQNMFIGFCHRYYLNEDSKMDLFKKAAISLLEDKTFSDEFCKNNIMTIMVYKLEPENREITLEKNTDYKYQIVYSLADALFTSEEKNVTQKIENWIKYFLQNEVFVKKIISFFLFNLGNNKEIYASKYIDIIESAAVSQSSKLDEYEFSYIHKLDEYEIWQFNTLIEIIRILLRKNYITINPIFIDGMVRIFTDLSNKNLNDKMKELLNILKPYLLEKDYDYLETQFPV